MQGLLSEFKLLQRSLQDLTLAHQPLLKQLYSLLMERLQVSFRPFDVSLYLRCQGACLGPTVGLQHLGLQLQKLPVYAFLGLLKLLKLRPSLQMSSLPVT